MSFDKIKFCIKMAMIIYWKERKLLIIMMSCVFPFFSRLLFFIRSQINLVHPPFHAKVRITSYQIIISL